MAGGIWPAARLRQKTTDLYTYRHLCVKHHLTGAERRRLQTITRGLSHLRTLREIMDEVYRRFDRRCRTETALAKLAHLRARVQRFQKVGQTLQPLFSSNLEKALARHVQRRQAWQSPPSQDANIGLSCAHPSASPGRHRAGPAP